ncbi:LLM class flavin-dependent oxidoreductase [Corynebacterium callunae]|uniref:LLM class flavin-dependent oxidoreductase n=1 Tax=Corynebacterium callunae TaxID=1721 RepID=UPI00398294CF
MTTSNQEQQVDRKVLFNAFDMNCVVHQSPGLWTHPDDRARDYNTIDYWVNLAQTLEKGLFDGLFIADVLGTYDVYGSSNEAALSAGAQVPVNDPILLVSAMAHATKNLGFGITAGTAYEHPYPFARRLATLDHLTKGRVGWNVVTGYLPSAAQNLGDTDQLPHDERYNKADEYLEVVYKLLEGSWEDDAVQNNTETGVFTDPAKVHAINHHGKYFDVPGIAITEPSVQRTPMIYQAGASPRGLKFAGENAEAVFINSNTVAGMKNTVAKIRAAAEAAGRDPHSIKIFAMQTIITGATEADAAEKLAEFSQYIDPVGGLTLMSGWTGADLSQYELDEPITNIESNAIQSTAATISNGTGEGAWTVSKLGEATGIGGFGPVIVGSGANVAAELARIQDVTDVDGFNLAYAITPGTFEDIVEFVVPELQKLGRYKTEYAPGSLRNKLFGQGDRLDESHRGASYRLGAKNSTATTDLTSISAQLVSQGANS